jgi:hypothetical protein
VLRITCVVMRKITALLSAFFAFSAIPLAAQEIAYEEVVEIVEAVPSTSSERFVPSESIPVPQAALPAGVARFGPFRVLNATRAAIVDATDQRSPAQFAAMVQAYPGISTIEMIECPGTEDDRANLRLGRMIRERGIVMYVPNGGSVRSGGVELFLAGAKRIADPGSEFAVHSWVDDLGREAKDYGPNAPENRIYIDYYRSMGMTEIEARAFYDMTNSVSHSDARWLEPTELQRWVRLDTVDTPRYHFAAKLDSAVAVN